MMNLIEISFPADEKYSIENLETMTLEELINILAENYLLDKDILNVIETLREAVLEEVCYLCYISVVVVISSLSLVVCNDNVMTLKLSYLHLAAAE